MSGGPDGALLPDGRLRLHHGPIDLVIEAFGEADEVEAAYAQAWACFSSLLGELVAELAVLRAPVGAGFPPVHQSAARRMAVAVWPHRRRFVTPMAAVAGAVADEVMATLTADRTLTRAYVNNGGDIALHLTPGHEIEIGVVPRVGGPGPAAIAAVGADAPVRGIATSGWRGRSLSLGIADSVTVLAKTAAGADAAATLIANAVDVDHPAVLRRPASEVDADTDLGDQPVTVGVGRLPEAVAAEALAAGAEVAEAMYGSGLIAGSLLVLQAQNRLVGAQGAGLPAASLCLGDALARRGGFGHDSASPRSASGGTRAGGGAGRVQEGREHHHGSEVDRGRRPDRAGTVRGHDARRRGGV